MEAINVTIQSLLRDIDQIDPNQCTQELFLNLQKLVAAASGLALKYSLENHQGDEINERDEPRATVREDANLNDFGGSAGELIGDASVAVDARSDVRVDVRRCFVKLRRLNVAPQPSAPALALRQQLHAIPSMSGGGARLNASNRKMLGGVEIVNGFERVDVGGITYDYFFGRRDNGYLKLTPKSTKPTVTAREKIFLQFVSGRDVYLIKEGEEKLLIVSDGITIPRGFSYGLKNKGREDALFYFAEGEN